MEIAKHWTIIVLLARTSLFLPFESIIVLIEIKNMKIMTYRKMQTL